MIFPKEFAEEKDLEGDIVVLDEDATEWSLRGRSQERGTVDLLRAFAYLDKNVDFKFLLLVDKDMLVDLPTLFSELATGTKPGEDLYWGYFTGRSRVTRDPRLKEGEPKYVLCNLYLPYAYGGGYVLSKDLVRYLVNMIHTI